MKIAAMPLEPEPRGKLMIDQRYLAWLARQVKSPAQFEKILKTIPDLTLRAEVRKLVTPMLTYGVQ